jgi:hypothetical protein
MVRREVFFIQGIFVAEPSSGSYFSEGRKPERRSGAFFFSGIGITNTYPSPTEFLATIRSGTYLFKNNSTACIPILDLIDMFGE